MATEGTVLLSQATTVDRKQISFTVDTLINVHTYDFTIDALIPVSKSNTLSAQITSVNRLTSPFLFDGIVLDTFTSTFTIDGHIPVESFFTIDASSSGRFISAFTIDTIPVHLHLSTFTIDTYISSLYSFTADLKAIICQTYVYTGATPTGTGISTLIFKLTDDNDINTSNPLIVPSSGYNHSFWKTIALHANQKPGTYINNVKLFTDGNLPWTGAKIYIGDQQSDTYEQAVIDPLNAKSGLEMIGHSQITSKTDLFTYTASNMLDVELASTWDNTTGRITKFLVLQCTLDSTAEAGNMPIEVINWQYDQV